MKYIFLLALPLCLLACSGSDGIPSGIIARPKMETLLWQLMQVDEFTANAFSRDTAHNLSTERILRYRKVFELNQTSKEEFEKSYAFYMSHPDISKVMFDSISSRASRLRDEASHPVPVAAPVNTPAVKKTLIQQHLQERAKLPPPVNK